MKKSEFLKKLAAASLGVVRAYNNREQSHNFNWEEIVLRYSQEVGFTPDLGNMLNPIHLAVNHLARKRDLHGSSLSMEDLIFVEMAWEYYEEH